VDVVNSSPPCETVWSQVFLRFTDYNAAQDIAAMHLAPILDAAEDKGLVTSWFFTRKKPFWRLRFAASGDGVAFIHTRLCALVDADHITSATDGIYEPEIHAFGGQNGMAAAHRLFHTDSRLLLAALPGPPTTVGAHELSVLLCSALLRSAGQDWYEQGDVWARVAEHQTPIPTCSPTHAPRLQSQLRQLMTTDMSSDALLSGPGPLVDFTAWIGAFTETGRTLRQLATDGALQRGLRAVLTHHILFHWNRHGLDQRTKSLLAHYAAEAVFTDDALRATPSRCEIEAMGSRAGASDAPRR
jgi:thiopeptide-type bacteriocin biosynthesis protein